MKTLGMETLWTFTVVGSRVFVQHFCCSNDAAACKPCRVISICSLRLMMAALGSAVITHTLEILPAQVITSERNASFKNLKIHDFLT